MTRTRPPGGGAQRALPPRVRRVVTTRRGGVSRPPYDSFNLSASVGDDPEAVAANRRRLARETRVPPERFVWMATVHGAEVARVSEPPGEPVAGVDGLVTTVPGLSLVVLAADCVPMLAAQDAGPDSGRADAGSEAAQGRRVAGVAHAGWRGAAAGIADALVAAMREAGARPGSMDVLLGPAICGLCYEVSEQVQAEVEAALPGAACRTRRGTAGLDLRAGLRERLRALGVRHVMVDSRCTFEDAALYSYRRDGTTGRQAGVAWLG